MSWLVRKIKRLFRRRTGNTSEPSKPIFTDANVLEKLTDMFKVAIIVKFAVTSTARADELTASKDRYKAVADKLNMPWEIVACIHSLEGSGKFDRVLHNGERIIGKNRKTRLVPKGRGPFNTWEESAIDALTTKNRIMPKKWTVGATLDFLERYNGLGYRKYHKNVPSPYLWSGTQYYKRGKYVSDGKWSNTAVSKQVGAVVLLKRLGWISDKEIQAHANSM